MSVLLARVMWNWLKVQATKTRLMSKKVHAGDCNSPEQWTLYLALAAAKIETFHFLPQNIEIFKECLEKKCKWFIDIKHTGLKFLNLERKKIKIYCTWHLVNVGNISMLKHLDSPPRIACQRNHKMEENLSLYFGAQVSQYLGLPGADIFASLMAM